MQKPPAALGRLESRLLSWAQMTNTVCASSLRVGEALRLSAMQRNRLLDRMTRRGLIIQLQRGLYLFPEKLPPGGRWQPPVEIAVWHFLQAKEALWQETGPSAFNAYGLSEQMANVTTVYNDKVSGRRRFGKLEAVFIKVSPERLGHVVEQEIRAGRPERRRIGTLPRVVFDAVYDYNVFGTLPKAYGWIAARTDDAAFLKELAACVLDYGNVATRRRIGWVLEKCGAPKKAWGAIRKALKPSSAFIPIDPTRPVRGRTNRMWGVVENLEPNATRHAG